MNREAYQKNERIAAIWGMVVLVLSPVLLCLFLTACASNEVGSAEDYPPPQLPDAPQQTSSPGEPVVGDEINIGDGLELFVKEDPSFNGTFTVRERGDIILPQLGRVEVAGMSVNAAQERIESELEKNQLTSASVILDRVSRVRPATPPMPGAANDPTVASAQKIIVYMTGKVNRPGQHLLALPEGRPLGVFEAVLIAGGVSRFGDEQKVYIMRTDRDGGKHRMPVNLRLIEKGKAEDPLIGNGDIVVVPEKIFGF